MGKVITTIMTIIAVLYGMAFCSDVQDGRRAAEEAARVQRAVAEKQSRASQCRADLQALMAEYDRLFKQRQYLPAADVLRSCEVATGEASLKDAIAAAEIADYTATIDNKSAAPRTRLKALSMLEHYYPAAFKGREKLLAELQRTVAKQDAAEKRRQGVSIGMTQQDVLDSSWGRPRKINRTTYNWGTKEQWVYDGGYLYFTNGVLDAIQN